LFLLAGGSCHGSANYPLNTEQLISETYPGCSLHYSTDTSSSNSSHALLLVSIFPVKTVSELSEKE
jgi:ribonuclease BN (tRNA processing enzyme)